MPVPNMRLIFMGTPAFAVPSLEVLLANGYEVVAVVTAPDKPRGRGRKVMPSPVKVAASAYNIPVLQPVSLQAPSFLEALKIYQADLQVVVAFRMLPQEVWAMPPLGTFNLHASWLPQYRGAAPINWAIINGERETGVTTFFLEQAMDTGLILFQEKEPIDTCDTAGTLHERLQYKGAQLVLKTVQAIEQRNHTQRSQITTQESLRKKAPKIYKKDCQINWRQDAEIIRNFIRGLSPYPAAWTSFHGQTYKILAVEKSEVTLPRLDPGEVYSDGKYSVCVGTCNTPLAIKSLQLAGKKPMGIQEFLRGHNV
ncbi:MAG: methionyl-tRNA formyltransferase [Amoebophilaceae bacterium]|nr:methionyl-tRNA formyltransferase [Amoebophilaceae bacterium]